MRHEDRAAAVSPRGLAAALLFALLACGSAVAEDEPRSVGALLDDLRSPLASVRAAAEAEVVARGPAAAATVRAWARDEDPRLRSAAWRILGRVGAEEDFAAAREALGDEQPEVAEGAALAIVRLAASCAAPEVPPIPKGSLDSGAVRSLSLPLARSLDEAPAGSPPDCLFALGEGVVPCLEMICLHPRFSETERRRSIEALARMGGDEARRIVASLPVELARRAGTTPQGRPVREPTPPPGWWPALSELGCGPGLEDAHALVVAVAQRQRRRSRAGPWIRELGWRNQLHYYRFIAACPPAEGIEHVRELLDRMLAWGGTRGPIFPSAMVEIARAHVVVSDPTEDGLEYLVRCAAPSNPNRRRVEELGNILALVAKYKERRGVRQGVEFLIEERWDKLPDTVRAWALYLRGETRVELLREKATALITGDGAAATVAHRRLGAMLWKQKELGLPPAKLIRVLLTDLDPWMRRTAMGWAIRASEQGLMAKAEATAALTAGLADRDDGVLLYAAASRRVPVPKAARERVLSLAVTGSRAARERAWHVLETLAAREHESSEPPFARPPVGAALDARIRAAAAFRRETRD